jgi:tetratricopeptide (TPR) repeat protein
MNKIKQFRRRVAKHYHAFELEEAARHGEALLREHWNNRSMMTLGYANDIYNLARVHDELGNFERAVELYTDGAQLYTRLADGDTTGYTNCLNNLAAVLHEMGMEDSSAHLFGQLVSVKRFYGRDGDEDFADSLYNFANALTGDKNAEHAHRWHSEALKIRRQKGNTEDIIDSLHSLAFLHEEKEEFDKAVPLAESAKELAQGDDYTGAVYYLAGLYDELGRFELALPLYEEAMNLTRDRVGRHHRSYMEAANRCAETLAKMGRVREALALQTEICALLEGMNDESVLNIYTDALRARADLHKELAEYGEAENLLMRALRISRHYKEDMTMDFIRLIRLFLHTNNKERAMEVLVYALMTGESKGPGLAQLLTHLAIAFNPAIFETPDLIPDALHAMNNREALAPIIKKWMEWENELFIPAFLFQRF